MRAPGVDAAQSTRRADWGFRWPRAHGRALGAGTRHRGPGRQTRQRRRTAAQLGVAFGIYLALSVVLWWQVWSTHPTTVTTCGCGDTSLFTWFLEWPAYALRHGDNPFFTTALFHPAGINLLANTSVLAVGIPLAPVTWLFGPVATLNVASTLAPALTAVAMFWLLRRWVTWAPAAFVGGLIFGFSPFVFVSLAGSHLMTGVLVLLPLIVASMDELVVRQRRSAVVVGVLLGLLVTVQFFLGTEMLAMVMLCGAAALVLLVVYGALAQRDALVARLPHAARGLGVAAVVAGVLLAYPLWFALDGPAHYSGLVWPTIQQGAGITLRDLWHVGYQTALRREMVLLGGYEGPALPNPEYLGVGAIVVAIGGVIVWRRDRRLWFFGALGLIALVLSLGAQRYWTPWRLFIHAPVLDNVIPMRFAGITSLCAAAMVAIVVGRTYEAIRIRGAAGRHREAHREGRSWMPAVASFGAAVGALAVAALAVVPIGGAIASNVPITARPIAVPRWFTTVAPRLPPGEVVLTYPPPFTLDQSPETWQAVDALDFAMVGGSGPEALPERAGPERAGQEVLSALALSFTGRPAATGGNVSAVRRALRGWGVTMVVVPTEASLPSYERTTDPPGGLAFFTLAIGRPPTFTHGAWVWSDVGTPAARRSIPLPAFAGCTTPQRTAAASRLAVPDCVMDASSPVT